MNQKSPQTIYDPQIILAQFKTYLKTKNLSSLSIKNYLSDLRRFFNYLQTRTKITSIHQLHRHHLENYLHYLIKQGRSLSSLNRVIATFKHFGPFLEQVYQLPNPFTNLDRLSKTSPTTPTHDYIKHFIKYIKQEQLSSQTIKSYKSDINQFANWLHNHLSSTQTKGLITKSNIKKYLKYLQKTKDLKQTTIERKAKVLDRFLTWFHHTYPTPTRTDSNQLGYKPHVHASHMSVRNLQTLKPAILSKYLPNIFLLAFIVLFFTALGVFGYRQFSKQVLLSKAYPSSPVTPNRQLSFQGRLVDSAGTPITTATDFDFKLYDASTSGNLLYDTGTCSITPDQDGVFATQIGSDCGTPIPSSVFTENSDVWLEVTVGAETLVPRQQIATVAYALNAETIQGIPLAATMAAIRNTIVPMNQWGEVILGEQSPTLKSIAGTFQIQGAALTLSTATGTNGNIILAPDGTGLVKILSNTQTTDSFTVQNAQLTSGSLIKGYVGNDTATGNLLTLSSGSTETNQFTVDTSGNTYIAGNLGIGTTTPSMKLDVAGSATVSGTLSLAPTLQVDAGTCDASSEGKEYYDADNNEYYYCDGTTWKPIAQGSSSVGGSGSTNYLAKWTDASTLGNSVIYDDGTNVGIGTTSPEAKLDIRGYAKIFGGNAVSLILGSDYDNNSTITNSVTKGARLGAPHYDTNEEPVALIFGNINSIQNNINIGGGSSLMNSATAIKFYTSTNTTTVTGTERMRITSSGNVGIGTTSPNYKLDVAGEASVSANLMTGGQFQLGRFASAPTAIGEGSLYYDSTTKKVYYYDGTAWTEVGSGSNPSLWTDGGDTTYLTSTTDDLAIGGTDSTAPFFFDVSTGYMHAQRFEDTASSTYYLDPAATTTSLTVAGSVGIGTTTPTSLLHVNGAVTGKALAIFNETGDQDILTASASGVTQMVLTHDGNLGLGTITPTEKLEVDGNIKLDNLITDTGLFTSNVTDSNSAIGFDLSTSNTLTSPDAKLLSIKNGSNELMYLDALGNLYVSGAVTAGKGFTVAMVNNSSDSLEAKSLVVIDTSTNSSFTTTTTPYSKAAFGVVQGVEANGDTDGDGVCDPGETCLVAVGGEVDVFMKDATSVNVGDYVYTSDTAKYAAASAKQFDGLVGVVSSIADAASGYVKMIFKAQPQVSGSAIYAKEDTIDAGSYLELVHNAGTSDIMAQGWLYNSNNATWVDVSTLLWQVGGHSFNYRRAVTIDNSSNASTLTDYQVSITLDTASLIAAGKMQSDCDDIRFTDSNNTELSYWIESGCNTTSTKIWIKVPSIPANATSTIYLYYGNDNVSSASNGDNTFEFFDDFEDGTENKWDDVDGGWSVTNTDSYKGSYSYYGYDDSTTLTMLIRPLNNGTSISLASAHLTLWVKFGENNLLHFPFLPDSTQGGHIFAVVAKDDGYWGYYDGTAYNDFPVVTPYSASTWYKIDVSFSVSLSKYWVWINNNLVTPTGLDLKDSNGTLINTGTLIFEAQAGNSSGTGQNNWIDNYFIRQYTPTEPTVTVSNDDVAQPFQIVQVDNNTTRLYNYSDSPQQLKLVVIPAGGGGAPGGSSGLYTNSNMSVADGDYVEVQHNQDTNDYTATPWIYNSATGEWEQVDVSEGYVVGGYSFSYRLPITINNTGGALTDYQTLVTLDTASLIAAGQMRSDCGDIRFTSDTDGDNVLNYWLESGCNTSNTKFWVKVPSINAAGTTDLYAFYGSALASSLSNKLNTFIDEIGGSQYLQLAYQLDENTGTTAYDSSGNGYDGTLTNSPAWDTGHFNSGLNFVAANASYIDASSAAPSSTPTAFTLSAWVKSTNDSASSILYVADSAGSNVNDIVIGDGATGYCSGELVTIITNRGGSTGNRICYTTTDRGELFDGNWHHLVVTSDGTQYQVIIDNVSKTLTVGNGANNGAWDGFTATIVDIGSDPNYGFSLDGTLDSFQFFNTALSATDITNLYTYFGHTTSANPHNTLIRQFSADSLDSSETVSSTNGTPSSVGTGLAQGFKIVQIDSNTVRLYNYSGATQGLRLDIITGGIGQNSGTVSLHPYSADVDTRENGNSIWIDKTGSGGNLLRLQANSSDIFTVSSDGIGYLNGNLGIGTASPTEPLHIYTPVGGQSGAVLETGDSLGIYWTIRNSDRKWGIGLNSLEEFIIRDITGGNQDIFKIAPGAPTNSFYISSSGNVGIGTATPTSLLHVNGAVTGKALAIFNETGDQDILTASASGVTKFRVGNDGYTYAQRFVDLASSTYYLDPAATSTSLFIEGDIVSNGAFTISSNGDNDIVLDAGVGTVFIGATGAGKLDAGTIDPPYTINGKNYATYLPGMTGVKEETTGTVYTSEYIPGEGYRYTIDFTNLTPDSDLWLFSEVTHLSQQLENLVVLLSPAGNTRAWYQLDAIHNKLYIYSSAPTYISYRLTAPRFDADKWANIRESSSSTGFVIENPNDWQDNPNGSIIGQLTHTAKEIFSNLEAKLFSTTLITPEATASPIIISRNSDYQLSTSPSANQPLLIVDGELAAATISARVAKLQEIQASKIQAQTIEADTIKANHIEGLDAKIATLSAQTIVNQYYYATASATNLSDEELNQITQTIKDRLTNLLSPATAQDLPLPPESTNSATLPEATSSATINSDDLPDTITIQPTLSADIATINNYLAVIGQATITNLEITDHLYTSTIASKTDTLEIQPLGGTIKLAANTLIIDSANGIVTLNGDLHINGNLYAQKAQINRLSLGSEPDLEATSSSNLGKLLTLYDEEGKEVASIDASGSADFNHLTTQVITIATASEASSSATPSGLLQNQVTSNATAGQATLVSPNTELTITSPYLDANSLVYLTPTSNTFGQVLYVKSKHTCPQDTTQTTCVPSFTVAIDSPVSDDITFNWWIIQLQP